MNNKKTIILGVMFLAVIGLCLAPASASKTSHYTVKINNKDVFGKTVVKNTPTKKVTHTIGWKKGINYYDDKTNYKKAKYFKYRTTLSSHGNIYDKQYITKAKIKYRLYNYKVGKFSNKYSYKTIYAKVFSGGGNTVSYTANKNWVPIKTLVYMKNIKYK
ncbi:hypothetical protein MARBORIA2_11110 [Methanobrevibacter arboriphilus]|jgi:hypothetical protein|uniref:Uncharacterized protein n=1 Tax=Methanobrevibacter arboriphilus TaxID=39441 RepID=A0ACA8R5H2_METAZ|nr:hypothetical protein [Methanobrevibacter arboriphilus]BBL62779.1 hypothetical protein MarbSA_18190 [Methanobrevibacter arboriphilus]GLI12021.1 hypothetical protein MARBORIA2_11110 [Methanobrevibacter arboriphilus]